MTGIPKAVAKHPVSAPRPDFRGHSPPCSPLQHFVPSPTETGAPLSVCPERKGFSAKKGVLGVGIRVGHVDVSRVLEGGVGTGAGRKEGVGDGTVVVDPGEEEGSDRVEASPRESEGVESTRGDPRSCGPRRPRVSYVAKRTPTLGGPSFQTGGQDEVRGVVSPPTRPSLHSPAHPTPTTWFYNRLCWAATEELFERRSWVPTDFSSRSYIERPLVRSPTPNPTGFQKGVSHPCECDR